MSELSKKYSDSDVDSNSSWTLLAEEVGGDDDRSSKKQDQDITESVTSSGPEQQEENLEIKENESAPEKPEIIPHENEINHEDDLESLTSASTCSAEFLSEIEEQEDNSKRDCAPLDEYLIEKEVSLDSDCFDRAECWERILCSNEKRKKRKYKKSKADNLTTMTVVGAVLSLAGLSLICMLTPQFGKQVTFPDIQSRIEKNFTKVETPLSTDNDIKVYIDTSNKDVKLIDEVKVLEPLIEKCRSQVKQVDTPQKTSMKNLKPTNKTHGKEGPVTYEHFLQENLSNAYAKNKNMKGSTRKNTAAQYITDETVTVSSAMEKLKTRTIPKKNENVKLQKINKKGFVSTVVLNKNTSNKIINDAKQAKDLSNSIISKEDGNNKEISNTNHEKEFQIKKTIDKNNRYPKSNTNKRMERFMNQKMQKSHKKHEVLSDKVLVMKSAEEIDTFKPKFQPNIRGNGPNFVLVNSTDAKHNINMKNFKMEPIEKDIPNKEEHSINTNKIIGEAAKHNINIKNFKMEPIKKNIPNKEEHSINTNKIIGEAAKQNINIKNFKMEPIKKNIPNKEEHSINTNKIIGEADTASNNEVPKISTKSKTESSNYNVDFIACQLLQDICMLRLTGRLASEEKTKEKKLKRKLDKKKLRAAKIYTDTSDQDDKNEQDNSCCKSPVCYTKKAPNVEKFLKQKERFNFKPKLVNHYVIECQPLQVTNPTPPSNIDLLKELPFHIKQKRESIIAKNLEERAKESATIERFQRITSNNVHTNVSTAKRIQKETMNKRVAALLEKARQNNEEKLRLLEKIRLENRVKIQKIIKERRERMKKDASLGIYNIPMPKYTEVSEKLKQLKRKPKQGFVIDNSSESEIEKCFPRTIDSKISCELMTALKMGKKVSDSFRDWTLKKAPTLTCLKNYCNSKVSQISEKLSNQCFNQASITSSSNKEELDALKCRKEKHEQLKQFWRAKQEYLDKRIEICNLLKKKLSSNNVTEEEDTKQNLVDGVQLLDSIINDVLKSVKNSKSSVDNTCPVETDMKTISKSVGNITVGKEGGVAQSEAKNDTVSRNSGDLYNWLFEKKAMEIRRKDSIVWSLAKPGHVEKKKEVSKQDPSKAYQDKVLKNHN